ncbi:MAG: hypothetical protein U1F43_07590 [Myxococcota bacterium]
MRVQLHSVVGMALLLPAACSADAGPAAPALSIQVAPLQLPAVQNVCYALAVQNEAGELVWSERDVCAGQYGNGAGGDLAYVGTCDASDSVGADGHAMNTVTLAIENLYTTTHPWTGDAAQPGDSEWQNPCIDDPGTSALEGCSLSVDCVENADASVVFDITVMRDANQGFFDVAVNFADVFCSAKLDCVPSLLADAAGARGPTAIVAFACTSGQGDTPTTLYQDALEIDCDGTDHDHVIRPIGLGGNLGAQSPGVFQSAVYYGAEELDGYDKCYWNTAIGMASDLGSNCHLKTRASAAEAPFTAEGGAFHSPAAHAYPVIDIDVALTGASGIICDAAPHPWNGTGASAGVATRYTLVSAAAGEAFDYAMRCGEAPAASPLPTCPCFDTARLDAAWAAVQAARGLYSETDEYQETCLDRTVTYSNAVQHIYQVQSFSYSTGPNGLRSLATANFFGSAIDPSGSQCNIDTQHQGFDGTTSFDEHPQDFRDITFDEAKGCNALVKAWAADHGIACTQDHLP